MNQSKISEKLAYEVVEFLRRNSGGKGYYYLDLEDDIKLVIKKTLAAMDKPKKPKKDASKLVFVDPNLSMKARPGATATMLEDTGKYYSVEWDETIFRNGQQAGLYPKHMFKVMSTELDDELKVISDKISDFQNKLVNG